MIVATPSGITLAGEAAHQSIAEPLIGLARDGLRQFRASYVDEPAAIMAWAFSYMQRMEAALRAHGFGMRPRVDLSTPVDTADRPD
jgi:pyruvate dehydrogenase complex dehydrogenase (E1) component